MYEIECDEQSRKELGCHDMGVPDVLQSPKEKSKQDSPERQTEVE